MRAFRLPLVAVLGLAFLLGGCASFQTGQPQQPPTIYSSSDATALVYSSPIAASPVDDHPLRWLGFVMHPAGVALDYAVNRPFYLAAWFLPGVTGYTAEDAQLEAQRPGLITGLFSRR